MYSSYIMIEIDAGMEVIDLSSTLTNYAIRRTNGQE